MQTNDHIIKFTGSASLPEPLEYQHNYKIIIDGEVRGADPRPNDDGTQNIIYPVRLITAEVLKDDGKTIKSKDRSSKSKKLRGAIYFFKEEHYPDEDEEEFYDKAMGLAIKNIDRWLPYLLKNE